MINGRYEKKSPNIVLFYSWSDANIDCIWARSHLCVWQSPVCLWKPLKPSLQKARPLCSLGLIMLQYIIQERSQDSWNVERESSLKRREWNTILGTEWVGGIQLHISFVISSCLLPSCRAGCTDSFVSMLSQSVCAQSAHSCSAATDTALQKPSGGCLHYILWGGKHFFTWCAVCR